MFVTHNYKCTKCEEKFERFVHKNERDVQMCYKCGGVSKIILSPTPTTFKFNDK